MSRNRECKIFRSKVYFCMVATSEEGRIRSVTPDRCRATESATGGTNGSLEIRRNSSSNGKVRSWSANEKRSRHHRYCSQSDYGFAGEEIDLGCCQLFLMALRCIWLGCYVFCPPVPECIARKLAFHPPRRGLSYVITVYDDKSELIEVDNAYKAAKYAYAQVKPNKLLPGRPPSLNEIETVFVWTRRGSVLTTLFVNTTKVNCYKHSDSEIVVLFSQPNGSDLGCYLQPRGLNLRRLADILRVDTYAYDYSGFGTSTGHASEKNLYCDIEAVYNHILLTRGSHVRIVLLGYSIGTAPSVAYAAQHPLNLCGVVLIAPFTSGWRLIFKRHATASPCCLDRFQSYERASDIDVPVLICHGMDDETIPVSHGEAMYARMRHAVAPLYVPGADHESIFSGRYPVVFQRIRHFLHHQIDFL